MFNATNILINGQPAVSRFCIGGRGGFRVGKPGKIPRRIHESVHRIGFTFCGLTASRAGRIAPCWMAVERIAGNVECDIVRQDDRQVLILFRDNATIIAVNNRDRATPITLAGNSPVAQSVLFFAHAEIVFLEIGDCRINSFLGSHFSQTGKMIDENHFLGFGRNQRFITHGRIVAWHVKGVDHGQRIFASKIQIPLIVSRTSKHRTGAVAHKNKIADPNGQFPVFINWMANSDPRINAFLFSLFHCRFRRVHGTTFGDKVFELRIVVFNLFCDRMIRRNGQKARPAHCVRTG